MFVNRRYKTKESPDINARASNIFDYQNYFLITNFSEITVSPAVKL